MLLPFETGRFIDVLNSKADLKGARHFNVMEYPGMQCAFSSYYFRPPTAALDCCFISEQQDPIRHDCLSVDFLQELMNKRFRFALLALQATDGYFLPYGQGHYFLNLNNVPFFSLGTSSCSLSIYFPHLLLLFVIFVFKSSCLLGFQTVVKRPPAVFSKLARRAAPRRKRSSRVAEDHDARYMSWEKFEEWQRAVALPSAETPVPADVEVKDSLLLDVTGKSIGKGCFLKSGHPVPYFLPLRGALRFAESITVHERKNNGNMVLTDICVGHKQV